MVSRRQFVAGTAVAALGLATRTSFANPLGLPLGVQLYSVRQQMAEDFDAALAGVAAAGFTEVEAAALPKRPAKELRASLDKAGLRCVSAHHPFAELHARFDEIVAYDKELGCQYLVGSSPSFRTPPPAGTKKSMSLDDWHYMAEQFNTMGEKTLAAGVHFGYHNHTPEFALTDGKTPLLELIRLTEAKNVTFELDCGWAIVGGFNPIDLLTTHPHRFSMLHVKDFIVDPNAAKGVEPKVTELGQGSIDYKPIFAQAAKTQKIVHAFVEQEAFNMPWKQSLKVDADYMKKFKA